MGSRFSRNAAWRKLALTVLALAAVGIALLGWVYRSALADPVVRRAWIALPGLKTPLRAVLFSDIHVAGPDMPPERLERIVGQINDLEPDLVLIAGDFLGDGYFQSRYAPAEAVQPLTQLRPRLGTFAVLGNHDHWSDPAAIARALSEIGIRVLTNDAVAAGPLAIGGLDDDFTAQADLQRTLRRLRALPGPHLLLSHSPDPFASLPSDIRLMLAGHTHCGQIHLPLMGAITYESNFGDRYGCGLVEEHGRRLVVTGGLGTSVLPLRFGAPPELWLIELNPTDG